MEKSKVMLNENLLGNDKKDVEIARLKYTIERFKEYDEDRKKKYSEALTKIGALESYIQELEDISQIGELKAKIIRQRDEIRRLNTVIEAKKIELPGTEDDWDELDKSKKYIDIKKKNKELRKEIKDLKDAMARLVYENNKLKEEKNFR